jgi:hypothetical protein
LYYLAFGQTVDCPIPLLAPIVEATTPPSLTVRNVDRLSWRPWKIENDWFQSAIGPQQQTYLCWQGIAEFLITDCGSEIEVQWITDPSNELFNAYLLTQAISTALINKGIECFHGTAIAQNSGAIVFLGDSGKGKSTLATEFLKQNYRLVSDDIIVFTEDYSRIHSTLNRMKLYPDTLKLSGLNNLGIALNPFTEKSLVPLQYTQMTQGPQPVAAIFILEERGRQFDIRRLSLSEGLTGLAGELFNTIDLPQKRVEGLFQTSARIAAKIPLFSLALPDNLSQLRNSIQRIQEHVVQI